MTLPAHPAESSSAPRPSMEILEASPPRFSATPLLNFSARVTEPQGREVYTIALTCQVNIEPARRRYDAEARAALVDLFGEPERWGATTRSFMWSKVDVLVPSFRGEQTFDIPVACSFDSELAAVKYFYALSEGVVPMTFLFSGTIFYRGDGGELRVQPVPWSCDARFALPIEVWRQTIDKFYPNRAWVGVQRETLEMLQRFQRRRGLPSLDASVAELVEASNEHSPAGEGR
ncbi:MAG: DUF6084 family protein [Actinomycetota bacterium]